MGAGVTAVLLDQCAASNADSTVADNRPRSETS
jgi:hypothetical protein